MTEETIATIPLPGGAMLDVIHLESEPENYVVFRRRIGDAVHQLAVSLDVEAARALSMASVVLEARLKKQNRQPLQPGAP